MTSVSQQKIARRGDPVDAVVLASGGIDSAVCLALAGRSAGSVLALGVDYGQRNRIELDHLHRLAAAQRCELLVVRIDMRQWLSDGLLGSAPPAAGEGTNYVPGRNLVFLALAASVAEARGATRIYLGATAADWHHPDCTESFFAPFRAALSAGLDRAPALRTPLAGFSKVQVLRLAVSLGVPLELTWSCHLGGPKPCGGCAPCRLRRQTFAELALADPGVPA